MMQLELLNNLSALTQRVCAHLQREEKKNIGNIYLGGSLGFYCCAAENAVQFM